MASVRMGSIVSDIRGSVGDETFFRNQGGIVVRERTTPAQPASTERDARQAAITAISQAWSATLTEAQRETFTTYGRQHPLPDRFGRPKVVAGINVFVRSNVQRYRDESAITATSAPTAPWPPMPAFNFTVLMQWQYACAGNPNPDCDGIYKRRDDYAGELAWTREDGEYSIWYSSGDVVWYITPVIGVAGVIRWDNAAGPAGEYTAGGQADGSTTATLSDVVQGLRIVPAAPIWTESPTNTRLFAYAGQQVTTGRYYYTSPWRYIGKNTYDGPDWSLDPWYVDHWETLVAGGRIFARLVTVLPDGATSTRGHARADIQD